MGRNLRMNRVLQSAIRVTYSITYYVMWWWAVTGLAWLVITVLMVLFSRVNTESPLYGFVGLPAGLLLFIPVARRALRDRYLHRYLLGIGISGFIASILLGIHFYRVSKALTGTILFGGLQEAILVLVCFVFGVFFVVTAVAGAAGVSLGLDMTTPASQPPASSHVLLIIGVLIGSLLATGWMIGSHKTRSKHAQFMAQLRAEAVNRAPAILQDQEIAQARLVLNLAKNEILIPAGEFLMGSPEGVGEPMEHPHHKVYTDAYYIDIHEITVGQYKDFTKATGRSMPAQESYTMDLYPVANVDWNGAAAYCKWAGGRLPTEAEWEKAARGGTNTKYSPGGDSDKIGEYVWYSTNSNGQTHLIGQKKPNQYGLYDMGGNVAEWVSDWFGQDYYKNSPVKNPKGPASGECRGHRGGSWRFYYGLGSRGWNIPVDGGGYSLIGFRCVSPA